MKVHSIATKLGVATLHGVVGMIAFAGKASPCYSWLLGLVLMPAEAPCQVATLCSCNCNLVYCDFAKYTSSNIAAKY